MTASCPIIQRTLNLLEYFIIFVNVQKQEHFNDQLGVKHTPRRGLKGVKCR